MRLFLVKSNKHFQLFEAKEKNRWNFIDTDNVHTIGFPNLASVKIHRKR